MSQIDSHDNAFMRIHQVIDKLDEYNELDNRLKDIVVDRKEDMVYIANGNSLKTKEKTWVLKIESNDYSSVSVSKLQDIDRDLCF